MSDVLARHPGLVYTSAHDYSLQLLEFEEGYQIVSGSIIENAHTAKSRVNYLPPPNADIRAGVLQQRQNRDQLL